jgi:predicted acylesterase/phospholipase RssA
MSDNDVQTTMKKAREILRGVEAEPKDILNDAKKLKNASQFGLGRKLLARVRERPIEDADLRLRLAQLHALCTYKDPDLPAKSKLRDALQILREIDDLETTEDQETLGLAGSIHKRMWELDARRHHLEKSLVYYHRGYEVGPEKDIGYTSINAAYVLDLLASTEEAEARGDRSLSEVANSRREEARTIRERIVSILPSLMEEDDGEWLARKWWYFATLAEAYLGLEDYGEAKKWIARGRRALPDIPEWELESTATQLAALARLQIDDPDNLEGSPAWDVLKELLGDNADAIRGVFSGKLGLGLSGGGFRASLFHIGVLAKLAELDLLRHVHVLSCVSGGSILGAHYYLELRKLLQEKEDSEITREDYEELVARVAKDFLAGVQRNPRTRVAANPWANLKMLFSSTYSRTERVGELFERDIYSRVNDGEGDRERWINDLFIHPKGTKEFAPKRDNWKRRNKVPMLVLNATTLNTGHSWQFTASWMGESPAAIDPDVDGNSRLRRMYYHEAPRAHRKIRLGVAVGASACVPGLFEPIALRELYPGMTVRLVDGGVHDNQGIASLLEQDCTVLLVSDASGQMNTDLEPKGGIIGPLLRTNSVLMGRVRQAQFQDLSARLDASLLKGLMTVHLKKDLDVDSVEWTDCEELRSSQGSPGTDRRSPDRPGLVLGG